MRSITAISGSASDKSSNEQFLRTVKSAFEASYIINIEGALWNLPLYTPQLEHTGVPEEVQSLRNRLAASDAVIICTPEYLHNIPAVLKNALEWMTTSGELNEKPVLPITFAPAPPRGQYAMISLLQTLRACNARTVAELPLYRNQMTDANGQIILNEESRMLMEHALELL